MNNEKSKFYWAGQNDFRAGNPFSTGDEMWEVFRLDWQQGWSDASEAERAAIHINELRSQTSA